MAADLTKGPSDNAYEDTGAAGGGIDRDSSAVDRSAEDLHKRLDETLAQLSDVDPIEVNSGGIVPAEELVGRDVEKETLMRLAAPPAHGAVISGDRRIGKTSLLRAVQQPLQDAGHLVVRVSAETSSLEKFGRDLLAGLRASGSRWPWEIQLEAEAVVTVGIGKITLRGKGQRGKQVIEEDLFVASARTARDMGTGLRVIYLLDEITVLATALARDSQDDAREFLRTLRKARQELPEVAMFMAGSIGLHHALPDRVQVNDLRELKIGVLNTQDALILAAGLIKGASLPVADFGAVALQMVKQTSGFPYFLHMLVELLTQSGQLVTPEKVRQVFQLALELDIWDTRHYDTRIDPYYGPDAELVRAMLDTFAVSGVPLALEALSETTAIAQYQASRTHLLGLLYRLEADHYLRRTENSSTMANGLIRRIWRHLRRI